MPVDFGSTFKEGSDPNYMGAAKEASRFDFNNSSQYENLYAARTANLKAGLDNADAAIKGMIKGDVYESVDKLRGAQGVDLAADNPLTPLNLDKQPMTPTAGTGPGGTGGAAPNGPLPPEVSSAKDKMARLQAAYQQGYISPSHYYTQLEVMNRAIRSRFPGYRDEVDAMVQSVTGVVPANALRQSLLNDLNTAQAAADKNVTDFEKFAQANADALPPNFWKDYQSGKYNGSGKYAIYDYVSQHRQADATLARQKAAIDYNLARGNNASVEALSYLNGAIAGVMDKQFKAGVGGNMAELEDRINKDLSSGKVYTDEEKSSLIAGIEKNRTATINALGEALNSEYGPDKKKLSSVINNSTEVEKFKKVINDRYDALSNALINKDWGSFSILTRQLENLQTASEYSMRKASPVTNAIMTISKNPILADVIKTTMMRPDDPLYSKVNTAVRTMIDSNLAQDLAGNNDSFTKQFEEFVKQPGGSKGESITGFVESKGRALNNPALKGAELKNITKVAYGPDNFGFLDKFTKPEDKMKVFNLFVNPGVTARIQAMNDPQEWSKYRAWAVRAFTTIYAEAANTANDTSDKPWINVSYDKGSNQLKADPTAEGLAAYNRGAKSFAVAPLHWIEQNTNSNIQGAVNNINPALKAVSDILKRDGQDPAAELSKLHARFRDETSSAEHPGAKTNTWWSRLLNATIASDSKGAPIGEPPARGEMFKVGKVGDQGAEASISDSAVGKGIIERSKPRLGKEMGIVNDGLFGGEPINPTDPSGKAGGRSYKLEGNNGSNVLNYNGADLKNLNPRMKDFLDKLSAEGIVEDIPVTSGYRDPIRNAKVGGARYSQHVDGNAIDIDISKMSDQEKSALVETAIRAGAKGIGIYPGGRALHLDVRDAPGTWGSMPGIGNHYKGHDYRLHPEWARGPLKKLFEGS